MPQMGESITEGTITKWLKKVGDTVQRDEPLFEISTDKVDAEIPSPVAGTLTEIKVQEGSDGRDQYGGCGDRRSCGAAAAGCSRLLRHRQLPAPAVRRCSCCRSRCCRSGERASASSPLVRKIAKDNNVDLGQVAGHRLCGRITKSDILGHLERRPAACCDGCSCSSAAAGREACCTCGRSRCRRAGADDQDAHHHRAAHGRVEATSPHVHTVFKVDMTRIVQAPREGEEQVRAAQRREADLHAVHHARGHRGAAQASRSSTRRLRATRSATTRTSTSASRWRWTGD